MCTCNYVDTIHFVSDIFRFDNTYSWIHNKEVHYVIDLVDIDRNVNGEMQTMLTEGDEDTIDTLLW